MYLKNIINHKRNKEKYKRKSYKFYFIVEISRTNILHSYSHSRDIYMR